MYDGRTYNIVREGTAEILDAQRQAGTNSAKNEGSKSQSVFYNPIQQYNRDLSVLAIKAFGDDLAAVRKARHKRRVEQVARGEQRGKKRKRTQTSGAIDVGEPVSTKIKVNEETAVPAKISDPTNSTLNKQNRQLEPSLSEPSAVQPPEEGEKWPWEVHDEAKLGDQDTTKLKSDGVPVGPRGLRDGNTAPVQAFRILDALSATGLRALRYAKEIPMATSITANDLSASATASIKLNAEHNRVTNKVVPTTSDAIEHMHVAASRELGGSSNYHVIDLDPYGTATPFLDAAVQAIVDGGLLCVTCTDAGVFASVGYLEKTYSQYGGLPLKGPHAHEGGLRLILHAIATSAARYGLAIEPLLSLSIDFYARVFVRVHRSPAEVKFLASKTMVVFNCDAGCGAWSIQHLARAKAKKSKNGDTLYNFTSAQSPSANPHCEHCGFRTHHAGPMWGGPMHNPHFIQRILDMLPTLDESIYGTIPRIKGMLTTALNESLDDPSPSSPTTETPARPIPPTHPATRSSHPFFFLPSALSRVLHCVCPSDAALRGALLNLGYRTTRSHTKAGGIATDAPWSVVWETMREWVRQKSPVKEGVFKKGTAGWGIMQKDRSKADLQRAKNQLSGLQETDTLLDLKREVEAALYRITKVEEGSTRESNDAGGEDADKVSSETENTNALDAHNEKTIAPIKNQSGQDDPNKLRILFDECLGRKPDPTERLLRYQINPRRDWGPMHKARAG